MGYLHIPNLYRYPNILRLDEVYALEKVHGTSAHIGWSRLSGESLDPLRTHELTFYSGGEKHDKFEALFDTGFLADALASFGLDEIIINGEAYGGKCQGMSKTYGKDLKFVVFDVRFNGNWLSVPRAEQVATMLKLEFVHYVKISTKLEDLDRERDADSIQAIRNGMGEGHKREGIVLRPLEELVDEFGNRMIAKYKRAEFMETKTPREVNPDKLVVLEAANSIAEEWVTPMRLEHVLQVIRVMRHMKDQQPIDLTDTGHVISAMIEDIRREAKDEIVVSADALKAIGKRTARLYKQKLEDILKEAPHE